MVKVIKCIALIFTLSSLVTGLFSCSDNNPFSVQDYSIIPVITWAGSEKPDYYPEGIDTVEVKLLLDSDTLTKRTSFHSRKVVFSGVPKGARAQVGIIGMDRSGTVHYRGLSERTSIDRPGIKIPITADRVTPIPPASLSASVSSQNMVRLTWVGGGSNREDFVILSRIESAGVADTSALLSTDYSVIGLAPAIERTFSDVREGVFRQGRTLSYRVYTRNSAGLSVGFSSVQLHIKDSIPPVITIEGSRMYHIGKDSLFLLPVINAYDAVDGTVEVDTSGTVESTIPGQYRIDITAHDRSGNIARDSIIVKVVDGTAGDTVAPILPLVITEQPEDVSVEVGANANFRIIAQGTGLSYRWQRNGTDIEGANTSALSIEITSADFHNDLIRCIVSNAVETVTSKAVTITVQEPVIPDLFTVTFESNGGTVTGPVEVAKGQQVSPPQVPTKTDSVFSGWYLDPELNTEWDFTNAVTGDTTLYAKWIVRPPEFSTVTFESNGGTVTGPVEVAKGQQVSPPQVPTKTDSVFGGWYLDPELNTEWDFTNAVTGDTTLYAKWVEKPPEFSTVTFESNGGTDVPEATVSYGMTVKEPPKPQRSGYTFDEWYTNEGELWNFNENIVISSITLFAKWIPEEYTVSLDLQNGDYPSTRVVTYDEPYFNFITTNRTGYIFRGWFTESAGGVEITVDSIVQIPNDHTLYAHWDPRSYTITYDLRGGSNHEGNPSTYTIEDIVTFKNPTKKDFTFDGWYLDLAFQKPQAEIALGSTGSIKVIAKWIWSGPDPEDAESNIYRTVQIGDQVWTVENLRTTKYMNGNDIRLVTDHNIWDDLTTPAYCRYDNDNDQYGLLYNWWVVDPENPSKIAPEGWRVPTREDWQALFNYLDGNGGKMKTTGTSDWKTPNEGATNESGFSALPGGFRIKLYFIDIGESAVWWSTSQDSRYATLAYASSLKYNEWSHETSHRADKFFGCSIRLIKE